MSTKSKIIITTVTIVVAYAFGYYEAPYKVKTITKTVEVEKKTDQTQTDTNRHKDTLTTITEKPDGTKETVTHTVDDVNRDTASKATDNITKSETKEKEVTKSSGHLTLSALAGVNPFTPSLPTYGVHVTRDIIGPVNIGVWGLTDKTIGASVGLTF